jgi:hypothetical protein
MIYLLPSLNLVLPGLFLDKLGSLFLSFFLPFVKSRQEIPFISTSCELYTFVLPGQMSTLLLLLSSLLFSGNKWHSQPSTQLYCPCRVVLQNLRNM